jgi:hypothetical protein
MATLNKTQTWDAVKTIITEADLGEETTIELVDTLAEILAPKSNRGGEHPPVLDDEGNITEAWCRYHQQYEPADQMVIANNKSKGYCKAAASLSNQRRKEVQSKRLEALSIMSDDVEKAQKLVKEANILEPMINGIEFYDYWASYNEA